MLASATTTELQLHRPFLTLPHSSIRKGLHVRHRQISINPFPSSPSVASPPFRLNNMAADPERDQALEEYKNKLLDSREWEAKLKALRLEIKGLQRDFDVSEDNIKALQSVGQIIGEVLKQLDEERCK